MFAGENVMFHLAPQRTGRRGAHLRGRLAHNGIIRAGEAEQGILLQGPKEGGGTRANASVGRRVRRDYVIGLPRCVDAL